MYHGRYPRYPYHSPNQPPMMYPYHSMHSNHMYTRETVKEDQPMEGNQSRSDPNKKEGNDDNWKEQYPDQPQGPPSQEFPPSNHPVPVQPYQHGPQPYGMYGYMNPYYQQDPYMGGPSPHVPDEYFVYPNESYQHGHNFMMSNGQANSQEYVMHSPYGDNMAWSSNRPGLAPKHDEHESGRVQKQDTDAKEHSDPAEPTGSVGLNERSSNEPDEANRPFNHQLVFDAGAHTPMKYTPHRPQSALSPYWGHLDQATLAVTGLMSPVTPQRARDSPQARVGSSDQLPRTFVESDPRLDMKKGFINPAFHYYHYRPRGVRDSYVPPSPATQFMMSPQANPRSAAYFGTNYFASPVPGTILNHDSNRSLASVPDESAITADAIGKNNNDGMVAVSNVTSPPHPKLSVPDSN
mmetsp:Transcript_8071/g.12488  ORF Transcript_8071/g.12488 Transcript_8071/m.12488 type:complete len:407 (+) Transcript_8071:67-1287(+)